MIKKKNIQFSTRFKKGFAFFPVHTPTHTVWMQLYEVCQSWNVLTGKWQNDNFTMQTFIDWTKI